VGEFDNIITKNMPICFKLSIDGIHEKIFDIQGAKALFYKTGNR
jgi:hypothetical protein